MQRRPAKPLLHQKAIITQAQLKVPAEEQPVARQLEAHSRLEGRAAHGAARADGRAQRLDAIRGGRRRRERVQLQFQLPWVEQRVGVRARRAT